MYLFVFLRLAVFILFFQEIECLQNTFDDLSTKCQLAISNFTEEEGEVCALCSSTFQNLSVGRSELGFIKRVEKGRIFTVKDLGS